MQLTAEQVLIIGLIATVLCQGIKYLVAKNETKMSRPVITLVVFGVSIVLSFLWTLPAVVVSQDPWAIVNSLMGSAAIVFGMATLIYNILLQKVFDFFGL